jgi:hypothetical protein
MDDCVAIARRLGQRVGDELGIPVYLYEAAATRPSGARSPTFARGSTRPFADKLKDAAFAPDFGPARFNARSGAVVIGAREFLIAYNINLNTREKKLANTIAQALREAGTIEEVSRRHDDDRPGAGSRSAAPSAGTSKSSGAPGLDQPDELQGDAASRGFRRGLRRKRRSWAYASRGASSSG